MFCCIPRSNCSVNRDRKEKRDKHVLEQKQRKKKELNMFQNRSKEIERRQTCFRTETKKEKRGKHVSEPKQRKKSETILCNYVLP